MQNREDTRWNVNIFLPAISYPQWFKAGMNVRRVGSNTISIVSNVNVLVKHIIENCHGYYCFLILKIPHIIVYLVAAVLNKRRGAIV